MGKWVAYYRVSTAKQGRSGLGLEAQRMAVHAITGGHLLGEFTEVESGKRDDRPQLVAALSYARLTGASLVVAKLDRLSRNAAFLLQLRDADVAFTCADMPAANSMTIGIMAVVAEEERKAISRRTKEALAAAKARGAKLGGDRGNLLVAGVLGRERSIEVRGKRATVRRADLMPHVEAARAAGALSLASIAAHLNGLQIRTARGGRWYPASVQRLLSVA